MEKQLQREYSTAQFQKGHQSCIRGLFHFFDFHQRLHIKKLLSDIKHGNSRRSTGDVKNSKSKSNVSATVESHNSRSEEVDGLIEDKMKGGSPNKQLGKECVKTLIAKELSKDRVKKRRATSFPLQLPPRLLRTVSIHYSDFDCVPDEKSSVDENPRIELCSQKTSSSSTGDINEPLLPKQPDDLISMKHCEVCGAMNGGSFSTNGSLDMSESCLLEKQLLLEKLLEAKDALLRQSQSQEFLEALQIFNANHELLLKILQDPNSLLVNQAHASPSREPALTKSGSFPGTEWPGRMKLKEKPIESKSISVKERQLQVQYFQSNTKSVNTSGNSPSEAMPLAGSATGSEPPPGPSHVLKSRKYNGAVINRFRGIKQKLKFVIKESKKERLRISMDGILHKIPYGHKPLTKTTSLSISSRNSYESDGAPPVSGENKLRRTPSLNESLDRYSHLFDTILRRQGRADLSEGVRSGHDDGDVVPGRQSKKTFTRILSSPDIWAYYPSKEVDSDAFHDTLHVRTPSRISVENESVDIKSHDSRFNAEAERQVDSLTKNETKQDFLEEGTSGAVEGNENQPLSDSDADENHKADGIEDDELGMVQDSSHIPSHKQETRPMKDAITTLVQPSPISVLSQCFADDVVGPIKISCPKAGSELEPRSIHLDNVDLQTEADALDRGPIEDNNEAQSPSNHTEFDIVDLQVDSKDEADFNYVRDILNKSRFSANELLGTWHSPDQPVDPSLFDEIECSTFGQGSSAHDIGISFDRMLLFDLINEVLLEIHERSFVYSPWPLCTNSSIRPMPVGPHVLEEVWSSICWHLRSKPEFFTMDYIVSRDFTKNDGWMNIQPEAECVGLELEDWILDDLLDEVTLDIAGF